MEGFRFETPEALWLLLLVPLLIILKGRRGPVAALGYSSASIIRALAKKHRSTRGGILIGLFILGLTCLITAMARPQVGGGTQVIKASGIDILLALDLSSSMKAEDFSSPQGRLNRLQAVKVVTEAFIDKRTSDRIGMIVFAAQPAMISPLTLNHEWLTDRLTKLHFDMLPDGTAIGSAIASAARRLKDNDSKSKIIVLLTDGTNTAGTIDPKTAAEAAAVLDIKIYTIGVGSDNPYPSNPYLRATPLDEETLREIAEIGNGKYYRARGIESLKEIFEEIDTLEKTERQVERFQRYDDLYPYVAATGGLLLILQGLLSQTLWRRTP